MGLRPNDPYAIVDRLATMPNARGGGVKVRRNICFEKACQALWPGEAAFDDSMSFGFCSDNVGQVSDVEEGGEGDGTPDTEG